jgi:tRNA(Arg) A34 adenosine deaminase TadA
MMTSRPLPTQVSFALPDHVSAWLDDTKACYMDVRERMGLVVALSRRHVRQKAGGPFAAAVFDHCGHLVSVGVNMVVAANCSILHAEMIAIALAQMRVSRYDLSDGGRLEYELYATTEPCAMCFGAIPWSGLTKVVCGARKADAKAIGFDEGPKPSTWIEALGERGIRVEQDVLRDQAVSVLKEYVADSGVIYNAGGMR